MTATLSSQDGTVLVRTARKAVECRVSGKRLDLNPDFTHVLKEPRGVFVTLIDVSKGEALRGCIGNPLPEKPLVEQTIESAVEAASIDPRFRPVGQEELERLIVEVTVLSPVEQIEARSPADLPSKIMLGRHGLLVDGFGSHGLLLPQVAVDEGFDEEEFLSQCCMKAGLLPDAWLTGRVRVSRFEGQIFSERTPGGPVFERALRSVADREESPGQSRQH